VAPQVFLRTPTSSLRRSVWVVEQQNTYLPLPFRDMGRVLFNDWQTGPLRCLLRSGTTAYRRMLRWTGSASTCSLPRPTNSSFHAIAFPGAACDIPSFNAFVSSVRAALMTLHTHHHLNASRAYLPNTRSLQTVPQIAAMAGHIGILPLCRPSPLMTCSLSLPV